MRKEQRSASCRITFYFIYQPCYGLNCVSHHSTPTSNSYVEALTPQSDLFGDRASKEIIKAR